MRFSADSLKRVIPGIALLATAPVLIFPHWVPRSVIEIALVLLIAQFGFQATLHKRWLPPGAMVPPVLFLLLVMIPASFYVSPSFWKVSLPRFTTLSWSIAFFLSVAWWRYPKGQHKHFSGQDQLTVSTGVYTLIGGLVSVLCMFGMEHVSKLPVVAKAIGRGPDVSLAVLGFTSGFNPNEVAGMLTLFIPLTTALAAHVLFAGKKQEPERGGDRFFYLWWFRLFVFVILALEWTVLLLSQSRAGYLAIIVSTVFVLPYFGKRGYQALGFGIVLAGIVIIVVGPREIIDSFLYAGKQSGLSVEHLFTGRPVIWERTVFALRDFAFTGMGLGAFGAVVPLLYPMNGEGALPVLGDAHNFFLQTATDGGIAGLLIVVWILFIVIRRLARSLRIVPRMNVDRSILIGLAAALVAFLIYNLVDCIALGTKAGIAFWMFLALIEEATGRILPDRVGERKCQQHIQRISRWWKRNWKYCTVVVAIGVLVVVFMGRSLQNSFARNLAARSLAAGLAGDSTLLETAETELARLDNEDCRAFWLRGVYMKKRGDLRGSDSAFSRLIRCTDAYDRFLYLTETNNEKLAELAVRFHPDHAEALFWLAQICSTRAPMRAMLLYKKGLALNPADGLRWRHLGDVYVRLRQFQKAIYAYGQSCRHGDPGANGCQLAGRMAERLGDYPTALKYYRLSRSHKSMELEKRLLEKLRKEK